MRFQLADTADGSISCVDQETGQLCHNSVGAYTEAVHHYVIPSGLKDKIGETGHIRVLDACYGLGYNTWALINELLCDPDLEQISANRPLTLSVVAIERYPEVMTFLPRVLEHRSFDTLKRKIPHLEHNTYYRTLWGFDEELPKIPDNRLFSMGVANNWQVEISLWIDDLRNQVLNLSQPFDAIFHDPFSPQKMPELWTADLFRQYRALLAERDGIFLTYSTAAAVRGGLKEAGLIPLKTKGLGKKAGGTIGYPHDCSAASLEKYKNHTIPLEDWEVEYLSSKAGIPYRDSDLRTDRAVILTQRENEQQASPRPSGSNALKKKPRYL